MSFAPLLLTLQLIAVSVPIAAVIGIVGAWAASVLQSSGRSGRVLARLFLLSMIAAVAMPLVLHAAAWEATAGKFGWWTMTQTGARTDDSGVYGVFSGLLACGWIHGAFGAAIVGLATWHGTRQTPRSVIEQAQLDIGPVAQWWTVRLPIASSLANCIFVGNGDGRSYRDDRCRLVRVSNNRRYVLSVQHRRSIADGCSLDLRVAIIAGSRVADMVLHLWKKTHAGSNRTLAEFRN